MAENKLTYIIVLNYNAYQDTLECLKSIVNLNSKYYKIVLVDNASTDLSFDNIQKWIIDNSYNNILPILSLLSEKDKKKLFENLEKLDFNINNLKAA